MRKSEMKDTGINGEGKLDRRKKGFQVSGVRNSKPLNIVMGI